MTAPCKAGYYCARGSWLEDPVDGITGDICPPGRYCGMCSYLFDCFGQIQPSVVAIGEKSDIQFKKKKKGKENTMLP